MKNKKNLFQNYNDSQSGAVLLLVGLAFSLMVLAAGFTIDYARALIVKERMQWAVDAAALAGAKVAHKGIEAVQDEAEQYFAANFPSGYMGTSGGGIVASEIDPVGGKGKGFHFEVTDMMMETYLVDAVGFSDISVGVEAEVNTMPITPMDVVFSLDLSGSMMVSAGKGCTFLPYGNNCYGATSKLQDAKSAMNDLVDTLHSGADGGDVRFGIVGWSSFVNTYGVFTGERSSIECTDDDGTKHWASLVASQNPNAVGEGNANAPPMGTNCREYIPGTIRNVGILPPMTYLTSSATDITDAIDSQKAEANTDGALGMYWSYDMLKTTDTKGWVGWTPPSRNRSIVLLSDGNNTKHYKNPSDASVANVAINGPNSNAEQKALCEAADAEGINIYTIAYDMDDTIPARVDAKQLLQDCASNVCPDNLNGKCYFDARYPADLAAAMKMIGTTMMTMRLTK